MLFRSPYGLSYQASLSMGFSRKYTGVGCHFFLQGIFPTQGLNLDLPHCRWILYQLSHKGSLQCSGRSPGERDSNPLQYSCLENPMDRGAWRATVHGVATVGHDLATKLSPPGLETLNSPPQKRLHSQSSRAVGLPSSLP